MDPAEQRISAKTYADLVLVTADLPASSGANLPAPLSLPHRETSVLERLVDDEGDVAAARRVVLLEEREPRSQGGQVAGHGRPATAVRDSAGVGGERAAEAESCGPPVARPCRAPRRQQSLPGRSSPRRRSPPPTNRRGLRGRRVPAAVT